ncbi:MAG: hypothetical protein K6C05_04230 [Anaerovibrio sp.]|nr:hypothetical protein [Anaerovibrio sp.]
MTLYNGYNDPNINLVDDLNKYAEKILKQHNISIKHKDSAYLDYMRYLHRRIPIKPRNILKSDVFSCPLEYENALKSMEQKIENGSNLNPYLTKSIDNGLFEDNLLNYWNIYHFHITDKLDNRNSKFSARSNMLLLAIVNDETVYMLQILPHNAENIWSRQEYLSIVHRNWPSLLGRCKIEGASIDQVLTDKEMGVLQKAQVNTFVAIGNDLYMPMGGGEAGDGSPINIVLKWNQIHNYLRRSEMILRDDFWNITKEAGFDGLIDKTQVKLTLHSFEINKYVITIVENSRLAYMLKYGRDKSITAIGYIDDIMDYMQG